MNARNRKRPPVEHDRYYTPKWVVDQCMDHVLPVVFDGARPTALLDPCCGTGAFGAGLAARYQDAYVIGFDNNPHTKPNGHNEVHICDVSEALAACGEAFSAAVGNPPFTIATTVVDECRKMATRTVLLVRAGFLSSSKRYNWWQRNKPSDVFFMSSRPGFDVPEWYRVLHGDMSGGDSTDYVFIAWDETYKGQVRAQQGGRIHLLPPRKK